MTDNKHHNCNADPRWFALVNDQVKIAPRQVLPVSLLRELASIPGGHVLLRDHESDQDILLDNESEVNLAEGNVFFSRKKEDCEQTATCSTPAKMALSVDDRFEIIQVGKLSQEGLRQLFDLGEDQQIFRDFESPDDVPLAVDAGISFADGPVFYTRRQGKPKTVKISINNKEYAIDPGQTTVKELKKLGSVTAGDELVQIINGEVVALEDGGSVCIRGGEVFVSHPRQGGAA
jgi:hypothetical protein